MGIVDIINIIVEIGSYNIVDYNRLRSYNWSLIIKLVKIGRYI